MIDIKNMSFGYARQRHQIYKSLDLSIGEGNIYGLLGKNGSGKSTLLYLISGLLRPDSGRITVDDMESKKRCAEMLSEMFIVAEEFRLPEVSLDQYVKIVHKFYPRFSRNILNECLNDFELPLSLKLNELSMGQKKKVYISIALAANTKYLLMDEPTNGLDIPSKSQFRKVIAKNMNAERTMIISTHQVHDIEALLDNILIIDKGVVTFNKSVQEICQEYTFEYRQPCEGNDGVVYAEPTLQGNAVMAHRGDRQETQMNLELLFNAVNAGKI
ncbi:MAG: ABC transporter ATP-binding protein [Prevotella sp.]|nr:ABC transporter ATP-binding protein [Prevotella sp.]